MQLVVGSHVAEAGTQINEQFQLDQIERQWLERAARKLKGTCQVHYV